MPKTKKIKAWAVVCKKDAYEYRVGELAQIGLYRKVLKLSLDHFGSKYFKIVPIEISYPKKK